MRRALREAAKNGVSLVLRAELDGCRYMLGAGLRTTALVDSRPFGFAQGRPFAGMTGESREWQGRGPPVTERLWMTLRTFVEVAMDKKQMKIAGIVALVVCAICIFVAIERYQTNANNVKAMNQLQRSSPLSGMMGTGEIKPATPAASKYAAFFAVISGVGGGVLLAKSKA